MIESDHLRNMDHDLKLSGNGSENGGCNSLNSCIEGSERQKVSWLEPELGTKFVDCQEEHAHVLTFL